MTRRMLSGRGFKIREDPTRAKSDWVYSEQDVTPCTRASRNTVPNWIKAGLCPVPGHAPRLFHGAELNRFHQERRTGARRRPERDELYCIACKAQQPMAGREVTHASSRPHGEGRLQWSCPECGTVATIAVSSLQLVSRAWGECGATLVRRNLKPCFLSTTKIMSAALQLAWTRIATHTCPLRKASVPSKAGSVLLSQAERCLPI